MSWKGTPVPNSGTIEKVYFNTNLSVEEVVTILETLTYQTDSNGILNYSIFSNTSGSNVLVVIKNNGVYTIATQSGNIFISDSGWVDGITNPLTINDTNVLGDYSLGSENSKLTSLVSITPFEEVQEVTLDSWAKDIADAIREKKGIVQKEEWVGTAVPNTGFVEKVYFNTNLSMEEVTNILEKLTYDVKILEGLEWCVLLSKNNNSAFCYAVKMTHPDGSINYQISVNHGGIFNTLSGWYNFANPYEINSYVFENFYSNETSKDENSGGQNDKVSSLFSITPFEKKKTELIPRLNFAQEIRSIEGGNDTSDATATASDILQGKTAYTANGKVEGTIETYNGENEGGVVGGGGIEDIIEVEELPTPEFSGTAIPSSGIINSFYINKNLSNEEIFALCETLEYESDMLYGVASVDLVEDGETVNFSIFILKSANPTSYSINFVMTGDVFTVYGQDGKTEYFDVLAGSISGTPLDDVQLKANVDCVFPQIGTITVTANYLNQNEKLSKLFSSQPFESNIDTSKIYYVKQTVGDLYMYEDDTWHSAIDTFTALGAKVQIINVKEKPTENILTTNLGTLELYGYYVENENDVFLYADWMGDGNSFWLTAGESLFEGALTFGGIVEDLSQVTDYTKFYGMPKATFYKFDNGWIEYKLGGIIPAIDMYDELRVSQSGQSWTFDTTGWKSLKVQAFLELGDVITITESGTYDVTNYGTAHVEIETPEGTLVTGNTESYTVLAGNTIKTGDFVECVNNVYITKYMNANDYHELCCIKYYDTEVIYLYVDGEQLIANRSSANTIPLDYGFIAIVDSTMTHDSKIGMVKLPNNDVFVAYTKENKLYGAILDNETTWQTYESTHNTLLIDDEYACTGSPQCFAISNNKVVIFHSGDSTNKMYGTIVTIEENKLTCVSKLLKDDSFVANNYSCTNLNDNLFCIARVVGEENFIYFSTIKFEEDNFNVSLSYFMSSGCDGNVSCEKFTNDRVIVMHNRGGDHLLLCTLMYVNNEIDNTMGDLITIRIRDKVNDTFYDVTSSYGCGCTRIDDSNIFIAFSRGKGTQMLGGAFIELIDNRSRLSYTLKKLNNSEFCCSATPACVCTNATKKEFFITHYSNEFGLYNTLYIGEHVKKSESSILGVAKNDGTGGSVIDVIVSN